MTEQDIKAGEVFVKVVENKPLTEAEFEWLLTKAAQPIVPKKGRGPKVPGT